MKELNGKSSVSIIEDVILEGLSYFERERLWDCIQEYTEILALKFYEFDDHVKASKYFYMNNKAQKYIGKGSVKIMKKFRLAIVGTALVGVLSIGFNSSFTNQAVNIGDTGGAPARPDYVNIGDTGGAPARPDYINIGDTGGAPADNKGDGGVSQL